jgi:hypothetical protein
MGKGRVGGGTRKWRRRKKRRPICSGVCAPVYSPYTRIEYMRRARARTHTHTHVGEPCDVAGGDSGGGGGGEEEEEEAERTIFSEVI